MSSLPASVPARMPSSHGKKTRHRIGTVAYYLLVILIVAVTVFPIYWLLVSAIRPPAESIHYPPSFFPQSITFKAFDILFNAQPIGHWIWNSTYLALIATAICILLAVLGAYTLSAMRWRGRAAFAIFLLVTQMLPEALIVVPIFKIYTRFPLIHIDLRNQLPGLSFLDTAFILPIGIWVLKNLFDTIPKELREAALVDGAGPFRVLFQIILPLTLPGLVAVGVVGFFYAWNEYLFAQLMTTDHSLYPAAVGLGSMRQMLDTPVEQMMAAGLIFAIPPVIFYLVMQRYIVAGITAGAVKG